MSAITHQVTLRCRVVRTLVVLVLTLGVLWGEEKSQFDPPPQSFTRVRSDSYAILFIGDSITRHGTNPEIRARLRWDHVAGMAASDESKDYAHRLAAMIQREMPGRTVEIFFHTGGKGGSAAQRFAAIAATIPLKPDLVVIQLGEHEKESDGAQQLRENYEKLVTAFERQHPSPLVLCTGVWNPTSSFLPGGRYAGWSATVDETMQAVCRRHNIAFVSVAGLAHDPSCSGAGEIAGVRWHPNDKGQAGYATLLFSAWQTATVARRTDDRLERDFPGISKVLGYIRQSFPDTIRFHPRDEGGMIGVPFPYTVPCRTDRFQALFYWDTYFTNLGLIRLGMTEQARNNVDDVLALVERFGYMPNANQRALANRSQPPFLALMLRDLVTPATDRTWLARAYATTVKEYAFWMSERSTDIGLNRPGNGADPSYLRDFYGSVVTSRFPSLKIESADAQLAFSRNALSEAETGWDFTPRFDRRAEEWCPVDLNCNLYIYEEFLAKLSESLANDQADGWREKAAKRKELIQKYLWNPDIGCYVDYDYAHERPGDLITCAALYPLFAGIATPEQASRVVRKMTESLEFTHGLSTCERRAQRFVYQWDYPNAWPPLQCVAIAGLDVYGFRDEARRIARKYVETVISNFGVTHDLWEKYNAVTGGTDAKAEYETPRMMGWTAGAFVFCADYLRGDSATPLSQSSPSMRQSPR